jgi:hypothetical protein
VIQEAALGSYGPLTKDDGAFAKIPTFISSSAKPPRHHELLHLEAEPGGDLADPQIDCDGCQVFASTV